MHKMVNKRSVSGVLPALLGLGLLCWSGLLPVSAQDRSMDADDARDPAPLHYPFASPGGLNLEHWTDYTQKATEPGTPTDVRMHERRMEEERAMRSDALTDDGMYRDPAPMNYLFASPGGLNLEHWKDYRQEATEPGTPTDVRMRQHRMEEERAMRSDAFDDGKMYWDPAPLHYPFAAPGSLHIEHWTDYTQQALQPGSAADTKMEKQQEKLRDEQKEHEEQK
jgi:hypothetical protein